MTKNKHGLFAFKIALPDGIVMVEREGEAAKRLVAYDELEGMELEVLGVPFGGHIMGRDAYGEAFHPETNIWMNEGDTVPVTYYHGFGPDDPWDWQKVPAVIGTAKLVASLTDPSTTAQDAGFWFRVKLDESEELAVRVKQAIEEGRDVKASSGAVGHLVRYGQAGLIDVWPVGELAIFDTNEWRQPANELAVVERARRELETDCFALLAMTLKAIAEEGTMAEAVLEMVVEAIKSTVVQGLESDTQTVNQIASPEDFRLAMTQEAMEDEMNAEEIKALTESVVAAIGPVIDAKLDARLKSEQGGFAIPNLMKTANLGDPDPMEDFLNWVRTGEGKIREHEVMVERELWKGGPKYKAAMQEGTTTEGGYLVPDGELGRIIEKRAEVGLLDQLGIATFTTDRDKFNIPTEGTAMTKFTIVAEEGAITAAENEPTVGQVATTIYNFKKLIKVSTEIMEDENSGLAGFLDRALGRAWGITENYYLQVGSGSSMPQGAFVGGTAGLTLDSASAIAAAEIPELIGKLKIPYRTGAVMMMNRTTGAYLAGLASTSQPVFRTPPISTIGAGGADLGIGYPVYLTEDAATIAASAKTMLFGNFEFYGWVRNRSLRMQRLVELYAGNGQIGLLAFFRAGGGVLQAEAFQYATHPTA